METTKFIDSMSLHILFLKPRRTRIIIRVKAFVQINDRVFQVINSRLIDDTKVVSTEVHLHEWSTFLLRYTVPMIDQNCYKSTSTILGVVPEVLSRFVLELLHRYFHYSLHLLQWYFHDSLYLLQRYFQESVWSCYRGTSIID